MENRHALGRKPGPAEPATLKTYSHSEGHDTRGALRTNIDNACMQTLPSTAADTRFCPSGVKATCRTSALWSSNLHTSDPSAMLHKRTVRSLDADATYRSHGEMHTEFTCPVCPPRDTCRENPLLGVSPGQQRSGSAGFRRSTAIVGMGPSSSSSQIGRAHV